MLQGIFSYSPVPGLFAVGFVRHLSLAETFRMALAVSAASALSLFTGDFDPADYERLYPEVSIDKVL